PGSRRSPGGSSASGWGRHIGSEGSVEVAQPAASDNEARSRNRRSAWCRTVLGRNMSDALLVELMLQLLDLILGGQILLLGLVGTLHLLAVLHQALLGSAAALLGVLQAQALQGELSLGL